MPMTDHTAAPSSLTAPGASRTVVLGSTSRYRRELMNRLRLPFEIDAPEVDETPLDGESPEALARRLALAKAHAVALRHPESLVIGSDQVADLDGLPLGKPGTHERAVQQLRLMRGRTVIFQTAVAVVCHATGFEQLDLAPVRVRFRDLSDAEIENYLRAEEPYDCAGSAKSDRRSMLAGKSSRPKSKGADCFQQPGAPSSHPPMAKAPPTSGFR